MNNSCWRLCWEFLKIGTFTIGGGTAMIPQIKATAVDEKGWLTEDEMLDCITISQSLPGIIAVNLATYVGYKQRGIVGALVSTLGVTLPAFIAIIIAMMILDIIQNNPFVMGAFMGVKAAVCGLIVVTAIKLIVQMCSSVKCNKSLSSRAKKINIGFIVIMSALSFIAVGFCSVTAIAVILAGIVLGIAFHFLNLVLEVGK
ncbi:MAG: chromate transporter [Bacillota bacterium]|nr:chromate transporter [Bacillota bacterium]